MPNSITNDIYASGYHDVYICIAQSLVFIRGLYNQSLLKTQREIN